MAVKVGEKALVLNDTYRSPELGEYISNFRIKKQYVFSEPKEAQEQFRPDCMTSDGGMADVQCFIDDGYQLQVEIRFMDSNWNISMSYSSDDTHQIFNLNHVNIDCLNGENEISWNDASKEYNLGFEFAFEDPEGTSPICGLFEVGKADFGGIYTVEEEYITPEKKSLYWAPQRIGLTVDPNTVIKGTRYFCDDGVVEGQLGNSIDKDVIKTLDTLLTDIMSLQPSSCAEMFRDCGKDSKINDLIKYLDTSQSTNFSLMFLNNKASNLDLSNFKTSKGTNFYGMFNGMSNIESLDLSNFDFSGLTENYGLYNLFENCSSLKNVIFPNTTLTNVYGLNYMCSANTSLEHFSFGNLKISAESFVMERTFNGCRSLKTVDLSGITTTSSYILLNNTFYGCSSLELVDLRNAKTLDSRDWSFCFKNVPSTCVVIVKDNTVKHALLSSVKSKVIVKTVAEYEAA